MDSNNSRKILTVNSFKEELDHIMTSVIADIDALQKRSPGDVAIDQGYLVQPNPINVVAGLGPMFSKLPREIRDMIFEEMLASGQPQFLRTSKIMNQEGADMIPKHGVLRINIGFGAMISHPTITQKVADTVQNLRLRVNMTDYISFALGRYPERAFPKMLKMFSNPKISRKSCNVFFEGRSASHRLIALEVVYSLKLLKEFEEVTLSIDASSFGGGKETNQNRHVSLDIAYFELEQHLGAAYRVKEKVGPQLVFYPRGSGQAVVKDRAGKEKRQWVMWEDGKAYVAM